jgi:hypothetical protein
MTEQYYTLDTSLFDGQFRYFGKDPVQVRGKVHQSEEQYHLHKAETEIEPITMLRGTRHYIHCKPFVLVPDIRLTIGLYPQQSETGAIGEVLEAHQQKHKEVEIGQAQAWYYPTDKVLVLWECFLFEFARDKPLLEDVNMKSLWEGFTRFLLQQFPEAARITTPHHDPIFDTEEYHQFLSSLGYGPVAKAAWGKSIDRE